VDANAEVTGLVWLGGRRFELRRFERPLPGPGEVLVEVHRATVCGSDVHTVTGRRSAPCPSILGHEAVGRIVALGSGGRRDERGRGLGLGDRVVWGVTASCGECDRCQRGRTAKCRRLAKTGHEPLDGPWPLSGAYASHVLLDPGLAVVTVPDIVPDGVAATAACAGATVMACVEAAGPLDQRRVLVSGLGMLGITACAVAAARGAHVTGRDPDHDRRALAQRFGAAAVDAPVGSGPVDGTRFDVVLELSGAADAVAEALRVVDVGGTVALAGSVSASAPVALDPEQVVRRLLTISGIHNYEPRHLTEAVDFLTGAAGLDRVIAPPVPLDALPDLLTGQPGGPLRRSVDPRAHPTGRGG
jgi:threonine 3-dehydrogenase